MQETNSVSETMHYWPTVSLMQYDTYLYFVKGASEHLLESTLSAACCHGYTTYRQRPCREALALAMWHNVNVCH